MATQAAVTEHSKDCQAIALLAFADAVTRSFSPCFLFHRNVMQLLTDVKVSAALEVLYVHADKPSQMPGASSRRDFVHVVRNSAGQLVVVDQARTTTRQPPLSPPLRGTSARQPPPPPPIMGTIARQPPPPPP